MKGPSNTPIPLEETAFKKTSRSSQSKGELVCKCVHWFQSPFTGKAASLLTNKVFSNAARSSFAGAWSPVHAGGWRIFQVFTELIVFRRP